MMNEWDIANAKREAEERAEARGEARGRAEGKAEMIKDCFKAGLSVEILSQISGFPIDKVKAILSI